MTDAAARRAARDAFLGVYQADLERGAVRPLPAYQAMFPDFGPDIAEEFAMLEDEGDTLAAPRPLPIDRGTLGPYRILDEIGRGGQAVVYRAQHRDLGREVALKVLRSAALDLSSQTERRRFKREAEVTARLDHPGICSVYEAGEAEGLAFIAMRYVRGESLARLLARQQQTQSAGPRMLRLDDPSTLADPTSGSTSRRDAVFRVLELVEACARALHAAHEQGLVHRDVKPGNIMVDDAGRPVLLDFGVAQVEALGHSLTGSSATVGTPYYMAPEQVGGSARVDRRADVYALGVTLYECLTLRRPFDALSREALYRDILNGLAVRADRLNPLVTRDLQVVVETAMERDPDRRYATAEAFADDLLRLRRYEPVRARPIGAWLAARRWSQRHRVLSTVLALGGLSLVVALSLWARAERALADYGRLADVRRYRDLEREAEEDLWPALPDRIPAMQAWLHRADALLGRAAAHRERLRVLRLSALPYDDAARARDRADPRWGARLQDLERSEEALADARAAAPNGDPGAAALAAAATDLEARVAAEAAAIEAARRWRFDEGDLQWQHDVLAGLVAGLAALPALRGAVAARLDAAAQIEPRSLRAPEVAERWRVAVSAIAGSKRYGGLRLEPQLGLVPLRADPGSGLWEFAHLLSGEPPAMGEGGTYQLTPASGIVLVLLPGGRVRIGSPIGDDGDPQGRGNEMPAHEVELQPFFLAKYELTQAQWERISGHNPSVHRPPQVIAGKPVTPLHPVENVSGLEAERTLRRLGLVLPTEVQWEYAARGDTDTPWWTGTDETSLAGAANLSDRFLQAHEGPPSLTYEEWLDDGYAFHAPVGTYRQNPFGLHDMVGNVSEWCRDHYGDYGLAARAGDGLRAAWQIATGVRRGGSFISDAREARAAARFPHDHDGRRSTLGLRPAMPLRRE